MDLGLQAPGDFRESSPRGDLAPSSPSPWPVCSRASFSLSAACCASAAIRRACHSSTSADCWGGGLGLSSSSGTARPMCLRTWKNKNNYQFIFLTKILMEQNRICIVALKVLFTECYYSPIIFQNNLLAARRVAFLL